MGRPVSIHQRVLLSLTLACTGAAWWGCSTAPDPQTTGTSSTSTTSSGTSTTAGTGGTDVHIDAGGGGDDDGGSCTSTSAVAEHVQLDIIVLIDQSASMSGPKWFGTISALTTFFNDPQSAKIGAGLSFFPNHKWPSCVPEDYQNLDVPIAALPGNAFALTNSMPADAKGTSTPTWGAVKGTLMAATAYQDAHPKHKVVLVLATDGDPNSCGMVGIDDIAALAKGARNYNGILTFVIAVPGSILANINKIAVGGGTTAAYDITQDINLFFDKMAEIRSKALGCEFELPPPPNGEQLDKERVNFAYTPKGTGPAKTLLRADDLLDCNSKPGWYYDNNNAPTKIILCPASCSTVQADDKAKVSVLFGCKTLIN